jgi:hypothetical protein
MPADSSYGKKPDIPEPTEAPPPSDVPHAVEPAPLQLELDNRDEIVPAEAAPDVPHAVEPAPIDSGWSGDGDGHAEHIGELLERARSEERMVTPDLEHLAASNAGQMLGLEHNIKTADSLERKLVQSETEPDDVLRYTMAFPHDQIADRTSTVIGDLQAGGYHVAAVKNSWLDLHPGEHRQIKTVVESPNGYQFELQFHTPESFAVKEAGTHDLYEITRDNSMPDADRDEAELAAGLYSETLLVKPPGIDRIKPFDSRNR